jgi:hypothetical protein
MNIANAISRLNVSRLWRRARPCPPLERIASDLHDDAREELRAALLEVGFDVESLERQGLPRRAIELVYSLEMVAALVCAELPAGPTRRLVLDRLKQAAVMLADAATNGAEVDDTEAGNGSSSDVRNLRDADADEGRSRDERAHQ